MEYNIPIHVHLIFISCVITSFGFLYFAVQQAASSKRSTIIFVVLTVFWLVSISIISYKGFLLNFGSFPPRLFAFVGVSLLVIVCLFSFSQSREFIYRMPLASLTYIHLVRIPVEIVLWWLYRHDMVTKSMTFEGANLDILSGISAPFVAIFLIGTSKEKKIGTIVWNILALALLINIVTRAVMATPYFTNTTALGSANFAVFYFPYVLLPTFIVPVVFFSHLSSLYKLLMVTNQQD